MKFGAAKGKFHSAILSVAVEIFLFLSSIEPCVAVGDQMILDPNIQIIKMIIIHIHKG